MDVDMTAVVQILKALADETRFRIIDLLLTHDLCVGALADHLSMSKAAVSQHLQILRKAGLVKGEKRGYWTHYGVDKDVIREIAEALKETVEQASDFSTTCHRSIQDDAKTGALKRKEFVMYQDSCQQPLKLMDKPGPCTLEQIKKCHGDEKDDPRVPKPEKR